MPGPVPARSDRRRRRNKPEVETLRAEGLGASQPGIDPDWHPIAQRWFESLGASGQAEFYEASDWATAVYVAQAMSANLTQPKFSAVLFSSVMSAMTELLTTEGARRRVRLELERATEEEEPAAVAIMAQYRDRAGA